MSIIQQQVDLFPFNTFRIHSIARHFVQATNLDDLRQVLGSELFKNESHFILGGGSNILLTNDFDGLVVKVDHRGIEVQNESEDFVDVKVNSGESWHEFVMYCVNNDWGGIENLSLIPGSTGAAPMQNIGAYGVEICDVIKSVEAIDKRSGETRLFSREECSFGYRDSVFKNDLKGRYIISSITLTLTKNNHRLNTSYGAINDTLKRQGVDQVTVRSISDAVIKIRKEKLPDPSVIGNAGSFFKNPVVSQSTYERIRSEYPTIPAYKIDNQYVKIPAGWLIEQGGWKGKRVDGAGVHEHQALVIVNHGTASGEQIWNLAMSIQSSIDEKFGIKLLPEVNVIR